MFRPAWPFRLLKKVQNTLAVKHNSKFFKKKRSSFLEHIIIFNNTKIWICYYLRVKPIERYGNEH